MKIIEKIGFYPSGENFRLDIFGRLFKIKRNRSLVFWVDMRDKNTFELKFMIEFETIDINGLECRFQYIMEMSDDNEYALFKIYEIPKNEMKWFTYMVELKNEYFAKSENMTCNTNQEFLKKGIPEKIIPIASRDLNRSIISSPFIPADGNFLIGPSLKAWERLVEQNENAIHQENNFIYNREIKKNNS